MRRALTSHFRPGHQLLFPFDLHPDAVGSIDLRRRGRECPVRWDWGLSYIRSGRQTIFALILRKFFQTFVRLRAQIVGHVLQIGDLNARLRSGTAMALLLLRTLTPTALSFPGESSTREITSPAVSEQG